MRVDHKVYNLPHFTILKCIWDGRLGTHPLIFHVFKKNKMNKVIPYTKHYLEHNQLKKAIGKFMIKPTPKLINKN